MQNFDAIFVAIGTRCTGYGHITRTIEVFNMFRNRAKATCIIRTDDDGLQLVPDIPGALAVTTDQDFLIQLARLKSKLVVCDFLAATTEILSILTANSQSLASISPLSSVNETADIVISRAPVNGPLRGINLHGSQYVIAHSRKPPDSPERLSVGVNFGGSDPEDQLSDFVNGISGTSQMLDLTMMLGPGYRGKFSGIFDSLIENPNIDFSVHQSASKFWDILGLSDMLVVSGGLALYEAIHKNIPAIALLTEPGKAALIPSDLRRQGIPWIVQTVDECIGKIMEVYRDRSILVEHRNRLLNVDFSVNTQNVVGVLAGYVE